MNLLGTEKVVIIHHLKYFNLYKFMGILLPFSFLFQVQNFQPFQSSL